MVDGPPSTCSMSGACLFAHLQRLGVKFGDIRLLNQKTDILSLDILVGMDYYCACVNKSVLPYQKLG